MCAAAVVLTCAVIEISALADRSNGQPRNRDVRRYVLGEISGEVLVEQQFRVRADGLSAVAIYPRRTNDSPRGSAIVVLHDLKSGIVHQEVAPISELAAAEVLMLRFAPQPSRGRDYRLEFRVADAPRGRGIGLLATRGGGHRRAVLTINGGRPRWGDLVFDTTVDGAISNFGAIASQLARAGVPAPYAVLALLLLTKSTALFVLIHAFAIRGTPASSFENAAAGVS